MTLSNFIPARLLGWDTAERVEARWWVPFTPFFFPDSMQVSGEGRSIDGSGAYVPFETSLDRYRVSTYSGPDSNYPHGTVAIDRTCSLQVSESYLSWVYAAGPSISTLSKAYPLTSITVSATSYVEKGVRLGSERTWSTTLSEPLTRAYLSSHLNSAVGNISNNSGGLLGVSDAVCSTESSEGRLVSQGVLGFRGAGQHISSDHFTYNIVGDVAEFWAGKVSADVVFEVRENDPLIIRVMSDGMMYGSGKLGGRDAVVAAGIWQEELTESLEGVWRVEEVEVYGISETREVVWAYDEDPRPVLNGLPFEPTAMQYLASSQASENEFYAEAVTLVSRTGKRYKINFETVEVSLTTDWETSTTVISEFEVETDPSTLRVRVEGPIGVVAGEYGEGSVTVTSYIKDIFVWQGSAAEEPWKRIASRHLPDVPSIGTVLSSSATTPGTHLLMARQSLRGYRFGHAPLDGSEGPRYRTLTTTQQSTTAPAGNVPDNSLGGTGWPSGSMTVHYVETYGNSSSEPSREIITAEMELQGRSFGSVALPLPARFATGSTRTATLSRTEWDADSPINGAYIVRQDNGSIDGTLISRELVPQSLSYNPSLGYEVGTWDFREAAPGTSFRVAGQRLRLT